MYVIGVDGGGTKTTAALASKDGEILKTRTKGPSVWRNVGIEESSSIISSLIKEIKEDREVFSSCIALAGVDEEKKQEKKNFVKKLREKGVRGEVILESDQKAAFRTGTEEKKGVVIICGTGSVACGWKGPGKIRAGGWGYLADEGGAFYVGIEGFRVIQKSFDGRGENTKIKEIICENWKVSSPEEVNGIVYSNFKKNIPLISKIVDKAARKGDIVAEKILKKAAKEAVCSGKVVIENLSFKEEEFSLVLAGGMFNSEIFLSSFQEEMRLFSPKARIILPKEDPVRGAVKMAIEEIRK